MLTDAPHVINESNLSRAWAHAFLRVMAAPAQGLLTPLVVSISDFSDLHEPVEAPAIRRALDSAIETVNRACANKKRKVQRVDATAQTIFPHMCWSPRKPCPAEDLFERYRTKVWPRLRHCPLNRRGTYFLRMIGATGVKGKDKIVTRNQLGDVLKWYKGRTKPPINSATQVTIRDPAKDHTGSARLGFPCLQQVSFAREGRHLVVGAYYPTQSIFERAYGNYLGICRLGCFMAHETGLKLARVTIFVVQPQIDVPKTLLRNLEGEMVQQLAGKDAGTGNTPTEIS